MRTEHTLTAATLAVAALLAGPASASATLTPARPASAARVAISAGKLASCYTVGHPYHASQHLELRGGTPGDTYLLGAAYTTNGHQVSDLGGISRFNAQGQSRASLSAFSPPGDPANAASPGAKVKLSVKELTSGGARTYPLGTTQATVQALSVNFASPANPMTARAVAVSGTRFAHQPMYGFITAAGSSQVLASFSLGTASACGYVERAEVVSPPTLSSGTFELYVNAGATLNVKAALSKKFSISATD
jgi:hypothetical protein